MLLAGPISHTSTQYIDFVDFLHLPIILLILVGVELPLHVVVTILECCVTFSGVKLSIRSFVLFYCLTFITNIINYVTGLTETKRRPQSLTFTKDRQNKLSHVAKKGKNRLPKF